MRAERSGDDGPGDDADPGAEYGLKAEVADGVVGGEMRSEIGRLLAFSDAVFAIVITLLALELRAPEVPPGELARALFDQWPSYLAYVTSYLLIAVTWYNHMGTFRRVHRSDPWLHVTNLAVLFSTALLPFATAVVSRSLRHGDQADERVSTALFGLVGVLISISWLGLYHHLVRNRRLLRRNVPVRVFALERGRGVFGVAAFGLAGLVGYLASPPVALGIFLVLPIVFALSAESVAGVRRLRRRKTDRRRARTAAGVTPPARTAGRRYPAGSNPWRALPRWERRVDRRCRHREGAP